MARLTGVEYHIVTHNGVERYVKDESIPEGNLLFGDPAEHIEEPAELADQAPEPEAAPSVIPLFLVGLPEE